MKKNIPLMFSIDKEELICNNKVLLINTYNNCINRMSLQVYEIIQTIIQEKMTLDQARLCFSNDADYKYIESLCKELLKNRIIHYIDEKEDRVDKYEDKITSYLVQLGAMDSLAREESMELSTRRIPPETLI